MRIFDEDNKIPIKNVSIFLTRSEAAEMVDSLNDILENFQHNADHAHINDNDYKREITICVYEDNDLRGFNEEAKKLINEDN
ncbi:MAG: hypothetical protein ABGX20_00005 [Bacillus sp. (in: firmicutes)]